MEKEEVEGKGFMAEGLFVRLAKINGCKVLGFQVPVLLPLLLLLCPRNS